MAGRIWIPPYEPLGVSTEEVPGGGYIKVDASAGNFGPSPGMQLGQQAANGVTGIAIAVSEHLAGDNETIVKGADIRLGKIEQTLLFDPQTGFLNLHGQAALAKVPEVLDAYRAAQDCELAETTNDDQHGMLQGLNERRLANFTTQVERHTAAERQRWHDEAGERRIALMRNDARLHWSDDALLRRALGTTRFEVREKAKRKGWDESLTEAALRQQTSRILVSAIESAVERDPDRAQAMRTRYDQHIEAADQTALDALLTEAQVRLRAEAASAEILNASPPDGEHLTQQWRLKQAEAITEPAVRAATIRRLTSAAAADKARARTVAEQVLARVLKGGLTSASQIPIREWVALDMEHRQAIEARLNHNAGGTHPPPNPDLVDELSTEMTQAPGTFARRDLVPVVAHLPLTQWRRFHDWQDGLRRGDPATEDQLYAIRRGLQLAAKMYSSDMPDESAANYRADLVEEIDTWRKVNGKSPDDANIAGMFWRHAMPLKHVPTSPDADPRPQPGIHQHGEVIGTTRILLQPSPDPLESPDTTVGDPQVHLAQVGPHTRAPTPSNDDIEPACVMAARLCMMSAPPPDGAAKCMQAEEACARGVATVRAAQAAGATNVEGMFTFPDGTYVVVPRALGVRPWVVPNGRPPAW